MLRGASLEAMGSDARGNLSGGGGGGGVIVLNAASIEFELPEGNIRIGGGDGAVPGQHGVLIKNGKSLA